MNRKWTEKTKIARGWIPWAPRLVTLGGPRPNALWNELEYSGDFRWVNVSHQEDHPVFGYFRGLLRRNDEQLRTEA